MSSVSDLYHRERKKHLALFFLTLFLKGHYLFFIDKLWTELYCAATKLKKTHTWKQKLIKKVQRQPFLCAKIISPPNHNNNTSTRPHPPCVSLLTMKDISCIFSLLLSRGKFTILLALKISLQGICGRDSRPAVSTSTQPESQRSSSFHFDVFSSVFLGSLFIFYTPKIHLDYLKLTENG